MAGYDARPPVDQYAHKNRYTDRNNPRVPVVAAV